jgi:hypothetical protein
VSVTFETQWKYAGFRIWVNCDEKGLIVRRLKTILPHPKSQVSARKSPLNLSTPDELKYLSRSLIPGVLLPIGKLIMEPQRQSSWAEMLCVFLEGGSEGQSVM